MSSALLAATAAAQPLDAEVKACATAEATAWATAVADEAASPQAEPLPAEQKASP